MLSIETSSADGESNCGEDSGNEVLALINSYTALYNRSITPCSPFSSHRATLPQSLETKVAPHGPLTPSSVSVYYTRPPTPRRPPKCQFCRRPHAVCLLGRRVDRDRLIQKREMGFRAWQAKCQHWCPRSRAKQSRGMDIATPCVFSLEEKPPLTNSTVGCIRATHESGEEEPEIV